MGTVTNPPTEPVPVTAIGGAGIQQQLQRQKQFNLYEEDVHDFLSSGVNKEEEQRTLGALLSNPEKFLRDVKRILKGPEDFLFEEHQAIYRAILEIDAAGEHPPTLVEVDAYFTRRKLYARYQHLSTTYLSHLLEFGFALHYEDRVVRDATLIRERAFLNAVAQGAMALRIALLQGKQNPYEVIEEYRLLLTDTHDGQTRRTKTLAQVIDEEVVPHLEKVKTLEERGLLGVTTGLIGLDRITGGWQKSDLIVIAARPSMGKTALMGTMAKCAAEADYRVGIIELEMASRQIGLRLVSDEGRIDSMKFLQGGLSADEEKLLPKILQELRKLPIVIDDTPGLNTIEIRAIADHMIRKNGVDILFVDYIQLGRTPKEQKSQDRTNEIRLVCATLKNIAKEYDIPVVALSQMNRDVDKRLIKRPVLSDLGESGAIERDADVVAFIFRPEHYGEEVDSNGRSTKGIAEIIIRKQRNGRTGTVRALFQGEYSRFADLAELDRAPEYLEPTRGSALVPPTYQSPPNYGDIPPPTEDYAPRPMKMSQWRPPTTDDVPF